jgi:hypothetical protein
MLSTIVTWRNRPQIARCAGSFVELCRRLDGEVVIVDMGGDAAQLAAHLGELRRAVTVVRLEAQEFCKPIAQNVGAARSHHPLLFFCDCDTVLDIDAIVDLVRSVQADEQAFGSVAHVRESEPAGLARGQILTFGYQLSITLVNGRTLQIVDGEPDPLHPTRKAPGLLVVRRSHFVEVGGFDSNLRGWGWEDQDMIARLTLGAGLRRVSRGSALHITHDDASRVAEYREKDHWATRDRSFRQALANYDRGAFVGTYARDAQHEVSLVTKGSG